MSSKKHLVTTAEVKYIANAMIQMKRYFRRFLLSHPADAYQTAVLAALEAGKFENKKEADSAINKTFIFAMRQYGYYRDPESLKWYFPELTFDEARILHIKWDKKDICGVPKCPKKAAYNDKRFVKICTRHHSYMAKRRKSGEEDIYEGIEDAPSNKQVSTKQYYKENLDQQQIKRIKNLLALGGKPADISKQTRVSEETIIWFLYNTTWN